MKKSFGLFVLAVSAPLWGSPQNMEEEGVLVLRNGDTLEGTVRSQEDRLFEGLAFKKNAGGEGTFQRFSAEELRSLQLDSSHYLSLFISKEYAGVEGYSLSERVVNGPMELFRGRFPYKSCTCQKRPEIMEAWLIRKGTEKLQVVRKNKLLDRIKNAEEAASAFLPFQGLANDIEEREYRYSELRKAVQRYNRRFLEQRSSVDP